MFKSVLSEDGSYTLLVWSVYVVLIKLLCPRNLMHQQVNRFTVAEKTRTCPETVVYDNRSYFTWTHQQHFIKEGKELTKTGPSLVWQEYCCARLDGGWSHGVDMMRGPNVSCLQRVLPPWVVSSLASSLWSLPCWWYPQEHDLCGLNTFADARIPWFPSVSLWVPLIYTFCAVCSSFIVFACRLLTNHCTRQSF